MTSTSWLLNSNIFSCYRPENSSSVAIAQDHSNLTHLLWTILPVVDHPPLQLQVVETVVKLLHCLNPFVVVQYGGFLKGWYPTTFGFPTKNDHFDVFWGYHHLRKHPYIYETSSVYHVHGDTRHGEVDRTVGWLSQPGFKGYGSRWVLWLLRREKNNAQVVQSFGEAFEMWAKCFEGCFFFVEIHRFYWSQTSWN